MATPRFVYISFVTTKKKKKEKEKKVEMNKTHFSNMSIYKHSPTEKK